MKYIQVLHAKQAGDCFPDADTESHGVSPFWPTKRSQHFNSPLLSIDAELTCIALYAKMISACVLMWKAENLVSLPCSDGLS